MVIKEETPAKSDKIENENNHDGIEEEKAIKSELSNKIIDDMDNGKKHELNRMVSNIFGVLLSLKQSGEFNLTENRYLNELHSVIYEDNAAEFREINSILFNICTK